MKHLCIIRKSANFSSTHLVSQGNCAAQNKKTFFFFFFWFRTVFSIGLDQYRRNYTKPITCQYSSNSASCKTWKWSNIFGWVLYLLCVTGCLVLRLAVCWQLCDMQNQTNKQSMSNRAQLWNGAGVFSYSCINNGWMNEMWQAGMDFVHEGGRRDITLIMPPTLPNDW